MPNGPFSLFIRGRMLIIDAWCMFSLDAVDVAVAVAVVVAVAVAVAVKEEARF